MDIIQTKIPALIPREDLDSESEDLSVSEPENIFLTWTINDILIPMDSESKKSPNEESYMSNEEIEDSK